MPKPSLLQRPLPCLTHKPALNQLPPRLLLEIHAFASLAELEELILFTTRAELFASRHYVLMSSLSKQHVATKPATVHCRMALVSALVAAATLSEAKLHPMLALLHALLCHAWCAAAAAAQTRRHHSHVSLAMPSPETLLNSGSAEADQQQKPPGRPPGVQGGTQLTEEEPVLGLQQQGERCDDQKERQRGQQPQEAPARHHDTAGLQDEEYEGQPRPLERQTESPDRQQQLPDEQDDMPTDYQYTYQHATQDAPSADQLQFLPPRPHSSACSPHAVEGWGQAAQAASLSGWSRAHTAEAPALHAKMLVAVILLQALPFVAWLKQPVDMRQLAGWQDTAACAFLAMHASAMALLVSGRLYVPQAS